MIAFSSLPQDDWVVSFELEQKAVRHTLLLLASIWDPVGKDHSHLLRVSRSIGCRRSRSSKRSRPETIADLRAWALAMLGTF